MVLRIMLDVAAVLALCGATALSLVMFAEARLSRERTRNLLAKSEVDLEASKARLARERKLTELAEEAGEQMWMESFRRPR